MPPLRRVLPKSPECSSHGEEKKRQNPSLPTMKPQTQPPEDINLTLPVELAGFMRS